MNTKTTWENYTITLTQRRGMAPVITVTSNPDAALAFDGQHSYRVEDIRNAARLLNDPKKGGVINLFDAERNAYTHPGHIRQIYGVVCAAHRLLDGIELEHVNPPKETGRFTIRFERGSCTLL